MKIVYLADATSTHTQKWAKYFAKNGHDVHIISFLDSKIEGVAVHHVKLFAPGVINHSFSTSATVKKMLYLLHVGEIKKLIKKIQPDILHSHYATSYGILGALTNFHPFVISVWGSDILDFPKQSRFRATLIKWILDKADHVTATSRMLTTEVKLYLKKNKKTSTIPFGVDVDRFSPKLSGSEQDTVTIGIVKSLEEKYGIEFLIRAFELCLKKKPNLQLRVIGSGVLLEKLTNLIKTFKIEEKVVFKGFVENVKIPEILNEMDVFVMPSIMDSETFGVAVVEASACGLPVIASNIGGLPEVVRDNETGFLVEPENIEAIAEKILLLAKDQNLRHQMGTKGRQFVLEHYNWSENADQMLKVYQKLV